MSSIAITQPPRLACVATNGDVPDTEPTPLAASQADCQDGPRVFAPASVPPWQGAGLVAPRQVAMAAPTLPQSSVPCAAVAGIAEGLALISQQLRDQAKWTLRRDVHDALPGKVWTTKALLPGVEASAKLKLTHELHFCAYTVIEVLRVKHETTNSTKSIRWQRKGHFTINPDRQTIRLHDMGPTASYIDGWMRGAFCGVMHSKVMEAVESAYKKEYGEGPIGPFQVDPVLPFEFDGSLKIPRFA